MTADTGRPGSPLCYVLGRGEGCSASPSAAAPPPWAAGLPPRSAAVSAFSRAPCALTRPSLALGGSSGARATGAPPQTSNVGRGVGALLSLLGLLYLNLSGPDSEERGVMGWVCAWKCRCFGFSVSNVNPTVCVSEVYVSLNGQLFALAFTPSAQLSAVWF